MGEMCSAEFVGSSMLERKFANEKFGKFRERGLRIGAAMIVEMVREADRR